MKRARQTAWRVFVVGLVGLWDRMKTRPRTILYPVGVLYMSGIGAFYRWPPTGLEQVYASLIKWTTIAGPWGCMIRVIIALVAILAWFFPVSRLFERSAYASVFICCAMVCAGLYDAGNWIESGAWFVPSVYAFVALLKAD